MTQTVQSPSGVVQPLALAEARQRLLAALSVCDPLVLPLDSALGLVAARDVAVEHAWPPTDLALSDGWAVGSRDTIGAAPVAPVYVSDIRPVVAGEAVPVGCDAVLAPHQGREEMGFLVAEATVAPGENVLRRGSDLPLGAAVVRAGQTIGAFDLAVARLAGLDALAVRRPRVAIVAAASSGVAAEWLGDACRRLGAEVISGDAGHADAAALVLRIEVRMVDGAAAEIAPAVVGGECLRLAVASGQGTLRLPDRLDVAALVFETLVAPVLDHLSARFPPEGGETRPLARKISSRVGLSELVLLDVTPDGRWLPLAVGQLSSAAWGRAVGCLELGPQSEGMPEGTSLSLRPPRFRV